MDKKLILILFGYILGLLSALAIGQLARGFSSQSCGHETVTIRNKNGDTVTSGDALPRLAKVAHPLSKEGFTWPSHQFGIPDRKATERPFSTPALSLLDFMTILDTNGSGYSPHGLFLNVGAGDGCLAKQYECDEANQLLPLQPSVKETMTQQSDVRLRNQGLLDKVQFHGILFEPGQTGGLHQIYENDKFQIVAKSLDHFNVVTILEELQVPKDRLDVLKYDTDSMDCEVIDAILKGGYQPTIVMAEFNIIYPPPLRFNFMASPDGTFQWGVNRPHSQKMGDQCSLSYLSDIMSRHGYTLIQVDWWDAFFVKDSLVSIVTGGAPVYDDMSWYLHGYVTNAPSEQDRIKFLQGTLYRASIQGPSEQWLQQIVQASQAGATTPLDDPQQYIQMRTEFWWLAAQDGYVPVRNPSLASVDQRKMCHEGCTPQPFTLL